MIPPPNLIARLKDEGVSTRYLMDATGESRKEVLKLLSSLGATQNYGKWTLPSLARTEARDRWLAGNHSGQFVDEVRGQGRRP